MASYTANYDPYGSPLEQFGTGTGTTNLGFTGEQTDPSGLLYLRARYVNLSTGTFLTRDPVQGFVGGGSVRWNPYIYVAGNPVNYTDPSGRILPIVAAIAFGAVVGALVGGIGNLAEQLAHKRREYTLY
ncbi:MAG: RHS repeat-associated core domain-containing protein [Chloroflexota bacterium]